MSEIRKIINTLKHTYEKNAWHGPAVLETLSDISAKDALKKIGDSHSIIELVAHMVAWRNYVTEKLKGNAGYELSDEQNFPKVTGWKQVLAQLAQSQQNLIEALEETPDERLNKKVPNREFKFYTMLQGIIHHDLYHLGQIQIIKKYIA